MNGQLHFEGLIPLEGGAFVQNRKKQAPLARKMTFSLSEASELLGVGSDLLITILDIPGLSDVWERHGRVCESTLRLLWSKLNGGVAAQIG